MKQRASFGALILCVYASAASAQVHLVANGQPDTYALINGALGGNAIEQPDCLHPEFGRHVTQEADADLGKPVFVFHMHRDIDGDGAASGGCQRVDRQRNEIKTYGPSPAYVKGFFGDTVTYRWRFKLDAGMQPSSSFTHIHQIKAGDGTNDDAPIFTLTPRAGTPQNMELIWINSAGVTTKVQIVPLASFKGEWVEAYEKIAYTDPGTYSIEIRRVRDGALLLSYSNASIETWRTGGTTFVRPKWGIYRSLNNIASLRDEQIRFDAFCLAKGADECTGTLPPLTPTPPPTPTPPVSRFEAELLPRVTSGPNGSPQTDPLASGGSWIAFTARFPGDWIEYTLPEIRRGRYELKFMYKTNPSRGIHNVAVDGVVLGAPIDQYKTGSAAYPDVTVGTVRFEHDGIHTVRLTSTGKRPEAGNHAISADRFTLVADVTPPVLTAPADRTVEATGPGGAAATFSGDAVDDNGDVVPVVFAPESGSTFPLGSTVVTATATDLSGNTATATFTVTVLDRTAPALTVPASVTAEATGPDGASVVFTGSADDLVSGSVPVTFSAASGSVFPLGSTPVTASAVDAAGNVATQTFVVAVVDTIPPVLSLPANLALDTNDPAGAVATFAAGATDTVSGTVPVTLVPASGSLFPLGTTTVTASAADAAGNLATGAFTVTVSVRAWSPAGVAYSVGQWAAHQGATWKCIQAHVSQSDWPPDRTPALWVKIPVGEAWDYPVQYPVGSRVIYGGATYECVQAHTSQAGWTPVVTPALWRRLSS